jgi:hypothetical protein
MRACVFEAKALRLSIERQRLEIHFGRRRPVHGDLRLLIGRTTYDEANRAQFLTNRLDIDQHIGGFDDGF